MKKFESAVEIQSTELTNVEHQEILGDFIEKKLESYKIKQKAVDAKKIKKTQAPYQNTAIFKLKKDVIYGENQGKKFTLSDSILLIPTGNNSYILRVLAPEKNPSEGASQNKRKVYGKGASGKIIKVYALELVKEGQKSYLKIHRNNNKRIKRVLKKIEYRRRDYTDNFLGPKNGIIEVPLDNLKEAEKIRQGLEREWEIAKKFSYLDYQGRGEKQTSKKTKTADQFYTEMARFPRLTLQSLLKSEKNKSLRLTTQQRFLISLRLLENLQDIHQQNIVHLDLQPSNIMVDLSSAETYIIDIASAVDNGEDFQNSRGHELYMSAEGLNKTVANASFKMDIYSISVILGAIWRCEDGYLINKNKGELEEKHHNKLPRFTAFFEGIKDLSKNEQQAIIEILNNGTAFDPEQRQDVTASLEIFAKLYATWKPSQTAISFLQDLPAQLDSLLAGNIMQSLKETLLNRIENVSKEVEVVKKRFVGVENSLGNNIFSFFGKNKRTEPVLAPLVTTPSSVPANNGL